MPVPRALTIAGSDSGGGAGIQADLKTFAAHGVYGASAMTAITAQNTIEVRAARPLPPDIVAAQIHAVLDDIGADAIKTGMLANASIIEAVCESLEGFAGPVVVDPVMISTSGHRLLDEDAVETLKSKLLPRGAIVTPNADEAQALCGIRPRDAAEFREAATAILALGARAVLIKGGDGTGPEAVDWFAAGTAFEAIRARRIDTRNTHGTGCTLSAAIAANLALGSDLLDSVRLAKAYVTGALANAEPIGGGRGPVNHFWRARPGGSEPHGGI